MIQPKIFQQFLLVPSEPEEAETNQPGEGWRQMRKDLLEQGFTLLCAQSTVMGVPIDIIVGIQMELLLQKPIKDVFYGLAGKFGLIFQSGEYYIEDLGL